MPERIISNIEQALVRRQLPTITLWNRLEGRPRTHDFQRSLRAEIRDALWMLTRQWQVGEFQGDDAGSPVFAKIHLQMSRFDAYQPVRTRRSPLTTACRSKHRSSSDLSRSSAAISQFRSTFAC